MRQKIPLCDSKRLLGFLPQTTCAETIQLVFIAAFDLVVNVMMCLKSVPKDQHIPVAFC